MQVRVVRRVSLGEVRRRVAELEVKYGGSLDDLPDLTDGFGGGQDERERFEDYVELSRMVHALRGYGEGEDFDYSTEEAVELSRSEVSKLTPRRLELLDQISRLRPRSINDLAAGIRRDVKNVYNDLKVLEGLGFVRLVRQGRRVLPELLVQEIALILG